MNTAGASLQLLLLLILPSAPADCRHSCWQVFLRLMKRVGTGSVGKGSQKAHWGTCAAMWSLPSLLLASLLAANEVRGHWQRWQRVADGEVQKPAKLLIVLFISWPQSPNLVGLCHPPRRASNDFGNHLGVYSDPDFKKGLVWDGDLLDEEAGNLASSARLPTSTLKKHGPGRVCIEWRCWSGDPLCRRTLPPYLARLHKFRVRASGEKHRSATCPSCSISVQHGLVRTHVSARNLHHDDSDGRDRQASQLTLGH